MGSWVLVCLPSSLRAGLESMYSVGVFRAASITRYIRRGHFYFSLPS